MGRNDEFKLFIGGLHPETRTESLKLHFSEYGALTDCIVMLDNDGRSRGFGFVTYESADGFNTILDAGGRVIVDGKEVEAKAATGKDNQNQRNSAPQRGGGGGGKGGNVKARDVTGKIFVGGTSHLSTDALASHFSQYGEVTDAIAMTDPRGSPRGFGFVTFADQQDANAAVENINNIEGITVDCKHADGTGRDGPPQQQQGARPSGRNQQANNHSAGRGGGHHHDQGKGGRSGGGKGQSNDSAYKIFVGGLPNSVSTGRLQDLFQMYGPVVDCVAFQDRGFGYVTYADRGAMNRALQAGSVQIDGKWVEIKPRDSAKGGGKSGGNQNHHSPPPPQRQQRNSHSGGKGGSGGKGSSGAGGRQHEAGKMFVGGLNHSTTDSTFRRYFEEFGDLSDSIVMKKPEGGSRGFGFVTFMDPSIARRVINQVNIIDGQQVDAKMAEREGGKGQDSGPQGRGGGYQKSSGGGGGGGMPVESNKIFLGGLPQEMSTDKLAEYMSEYGEITDCIAMEGRGFGYVTFRDENSVEIVLSNSHIEIEGKSVEVKQCTIPRHKGQGRARPY